MARKTDYYIAIPVEKEERNDVLYTMLDMLRYDRCYPVSNQPSDFIVLIQPWREGITGGFTIARWASFGFKRVFTDTDGTNLADQLERYRRSLAMKVVR